MHPVKSYCPAALSFIFKSCPDKNLIKAGSVGVGCTVDSGVTASVEKSAVSEIFFNGRKIIFPTVSLSLKSLTGIPLKVALESPLPLGCGFGLSGASSLAVLYAANQLLRLKKTSEFLNSIAHRAEIISKTGLGSVGTQTSGGFLVKTAPGIPVRGYSLPFTGQKIYAVIFGKLLTPKVLGNVNKIKSINSAAGIAMDKLKNLPSPAFADILDLSYAYEIESKLLDDAEIISLVGKIKKSGGHAAMAILGRVVLSDVPPPSDVKYQFKELTVVKSKVRLI